MPENLPEPPSVDNIEPANMTAAELRDKAEQLSAWLEHAQGVREITDEEDALIDEVTEAFNVVTRERRNRHSEEFPQRGS